MTPTTAGEVEQALRDIPWLTCTLNHQHEPKFCFTPDFQALAARVWAWLEERESKLLAGINWGAQNEKEAREEIARLRSVMAASRICWPTAGIHACCEHVAPAEGTEPRP